MDYKLEHALNVLLKVLPDAFLSAEKSTETRFLQFQNVEEKEPDPHLSKLGNSIEVNEVLF